MTKRIFTIFLAFVLILGVVPIAFATETETTAATEETKPVRGEFECGDDLTWAYEDGVLTITGTGEMDDYEGDAPWAQYKDDIEAVILTGGVTYIGARAFRDYDALESVDFGSKLKEIGEEAFQSCEGLKEIELPSAFKVFGPSSFLSCKNLTEIHCEGVFPSFRLNCLWDTYTVIYYPVDRPWSVSLIAELEEAFHGRIEFLASDGTDPYTPEETTAATEETTVPETEAPTEIATEIPEETTVPVTEAPTEPPVPETTAAPETEAPTEMTQAPTEAEEDVPNAEENSVRLLLIGFGAAVILTLVVALMMVLRQLKRKGKYST